MMLFKSLAQFILTVALCQLSIHSEISLYQIRGDFKEFRRQFLVHGDDHARVKMSCILIRLPKNADKMF